MIYLMLFGLDFYSNLISLLKFFSWVIIITYIVIAIVYLVRYSEAYYEEDLEKIAHGFQKFSSYVIKRKWYIFSLVSITFLMPAPKTVAIATGLYAGEQVVAYIQDSPLAKKAYQLAEKKIDELLEESQTKDSK